MLEGSLRPCRDVTAVIPISYLYFAASFRVIIDEPSGSAPGRRGNGCPKEFSGLDLRCPYFVMRPSQCKL